ncbi:unnamed protein product, partial [Urochloa humidicola]
HFRSESPSAQQATEPDRILHSELVPRCSRSSSPSPAAHQPPRSRPPSPHSLSRFSLAPTTTMSSRRSRATVSEEEINELISRLQTLLPSARRRGGNQASTTKLLKETCSYIKSLHREVDDLSDRLSDLMATMDHNSPGAEIIRSLLR